MKSSRRGSNFIPPTFFLYFVIDDEIILEQINVVNFRESMSSHLVDSQ